MKQACSYLGRYDIIMLVQAVKPDTSLKEEKQKEYARIHTLKRVMLIFRPYRVRMLFIFLAILASTALNLVVPLFIPFIIDDALAHHNIHHLVLYGLMMCSAAILSGLLGVGQTYLSNFVGQRVMRDLRNALYAHLQSLSLNFFTSTRAGELQSRLSNDVSSAQVTVTETFVTLITNIVMVLGTIVAMLYLSPVLTLASCLIVPVFLYFALRAGNARRKTLKATQQSLAMLTALMQETLSISGILLIKTFGRRRLAQNQFEAKNQELTELSIHQQMLGRWLLMFVNTFIALLPAILFMCAGFLIIYVPAYAHITIGTLVAFVTVQGRFFGPFNQLSSSLIDAQGSLGLFERIFEYLDHEVEIKDAPDAQYLSPAQIRGNIVFKNVSFMYKRAASAYWEKDSALEMATLRATLRNLSFSVEPGQLVALVGPSGAGKTTITYLLSRLYDVDSGAIEIDGHDIRKIALATLENLMGVVTQETYLFHASIRDNLLYVRPGATDEEIVAAAKAAAIHDRIMELENRYDTVVGERGYKLSGGEKQRIAIARMLLKNPKILILDEATSSLDTRSERLIQRALESLMRGRTTIAIAHRLSTVLAADLILVLDRGAIVERGTHQELLKRGGLYARLYNQQFSTASSPT
jgi:ATP-binding cassette, subfamily B, bacterial